MYGITEARQFDNGLVAQREMVTILLVHRRAPSSGVGHARIAALQQC